MPKSRKANKGNSRAKSCEGKTRFTTRTAAHRAMTAVRYKVQSTGWMNVYKCGYCGLYHYGHARGAGSSRSFRMVSAIDKALAKDAALRTRVQADQKT